MFAVMDDSPSERNDSKRKTRNLSEKKRRDQFNTLVNELSAMVSATSRKMDKSTVLRSTIGFLKNYHELSVRSKVHDIHEDWKPAFLSNEEFMHLILEAFDGFIIVFSSSGRILYTSGNITSLLGYLPSDVLNMSIYDMMQEEDHSELYNMLLNPPTVIDPVQKSLSSENQVSFRCHLKRGGLNYRDVAAYEHIELTGYFRADVKYEQMDEAEELEMNATNVVESKCIFVGTARIQMPRLIRELSINGTKKSEFTSRHSLEWKFLFLDHRAPPIIGYLPIEVLGTSGYDYYHFDDLEQMAQCLEALKHKGEGTSCYYRFLTKGQQWLWLQTRFYITYHQWTSKPEFVVCSHRVINYVDVVQQMRRNNGRVEDGEDVDNSADSVERKLNTSASSMLITSPWSSQSSRSRMEGSPSTPSVSNNSHRYNMYHPPSIAESTYTDMSGSQQYIDDSPVAIKSSPPHQSTPPTSMQNSMDPQSLQTFSTVDTHYVVNFVPDSVEQQSSTTSCANHDKPLSAHATGQNTPQYLLQDQLQRKHEELQLMIGHQQDELRRVSEQLVIARYGMPMSGSGSVGYGDADSSRYSPDNLSDRLSVAGSESANSLHQYQHQHHHHRQQQQQHHQQTQHQLLGQQHHQHQQQQHHLQNHNVQQPQSLQPPHQQQHQYYQQQHQQQQIHHHQQHQQLPVDLNACTVEVAGNSGDEVLSYMQLQPVASLHAYKTDELRHVQHNQQHQNHPQQQQHEIDMDTTDRIPKASNDSRTFGDQEGEI